MSQPELSEAMRRDEGEIPDPSTRMCTGWRGSEGQSRPSSKLHEGAEKKHAKDVRAMGLILRPFPGGIFPFTEKPRGDDHF